MFEQLHISCSEIEPFVIIITSTAFHFAPGFIDFVGGHDLSNEVPITNKVVKE